MTFQYIENKVQTWGLRTSNLSEIVNSRLLTTRTFPPLALMSATTRQLSLDIVMAKARAEDLTRRDSTLTPYARKMCEHANLNHVHLKAAPINDRTCDVSPKRGGKEPDANPTHRITFPDRQTCIKGDCTCTLPTLTGVYCQHAVCAER